MRLSADDLTAYRRGVVLGLTLAELLLLLLFLFLLIMAAILHDREEERQALEEQYEAAEAERRAFRGALQAQLELALGADLAANLGQPLTAEQLAEPLARLSALSSENAGLRAELSAARSELAALREGRPVSQQEASALRQENARLAAELAALNEALGDAQALVDQAGALAPDRPPGEVLEAALEAYSGLGEEARDLTGDLAMCEAERANLDRTVDHIQAQCGREGDYPPCVYRDDGQIAYLYNVFLTQDGLVVRRGDEGSFRSLSWVASLPDPRLDTPIALGRFLDVTRAHYATSQAQNPECRFFVRIYDRMGTASRQEFLDQYLGVQTHFYHVLVRE